MTNLIPGTGHCLCPSCGELFVSEQPFRRHRIGSPGVNRRCVPVEALPAKGFVKLKLKSGKYWAGGGTS